MTLNGVMTADPRSAVFAEAELLVQVSSE